MLPFKAGTGEKKEKKVAESGHSGSALAVFTSPIPASCSRRRPKSLIAQLRAGLQKDKIEKEREVERERGTNKKRERENLYDCEKEKKSWQKFFSIRREKILA